MAALFVAVFVVLGIPLVAITRGRHHGSVHFPGPAEPTATNGLVVVYNTGLGWCRFVSSFYSGRGRMGSYLHGWILWRQIGRPATGVQAAKLLKERVGR